MSAIGGKADEIVGKADIDASRIWAEREIAEGRLTVEELRVIL